MARITVEDCIDKVEGPYDLVLIAKERAVQLNSGEQPNVDPENDKNTVIALKEIAEDKISVLLSIPSLEFKFFSFFEKKIKIIFFINFKNQKIFKFMLIKNIIRMIAPNK